MRNSLHDERTKNVRDPIARTKCTFATLANPERDLELSEVIGRFLRRCDAEKNSIDDDVLEPSNDDEIMKLDCRPFLVRLNLQRRMRNITKLCMYVNG